MKGKLTIASAACLLAAVGASVALASARGGSERTITAISRGTGITFVDADHDGKPSLGDYEIGSTVLVSPKSGKPIGHGSVVCTQINATGTQYQCQGVSHFAGGDVVSAGLFSVTSKTLSQAIVGGTGVYAGARGLYRGTWLDAKFARAKVVFTLDS
jgi:hypothetical protein